MTLSVPLEPPPKENLHISAHYLVILVKYIQFNSNNCSKENHFCKKNNPRDRRSLFYKRNKSAEKWRFSWRQPIQRPKVWGLCRRYACAGSDRLNSDGLLQHSTSDETNCLDRLEWRASWSTSTDAVHHWELVGAVTQERHRLLGDGPGRSTESDALSDVDLGRARHSIHHKLELAHIHLTITPGTRAKTRAPSWRSLLDWGRGFVILHLIAEINPCPLNVDQLGIGLFGFGDGRLRGRLCSHSVHRFLIRIPSGDHCIMNGPQVFGDRWCSGRLCCRFVHRFLPRISFGYYCIMDGPQIGCGRWRFSRSMSKIQHGAAHIVQLRVGGCNGGPGQNEENLDGKGQAHVFHRRHQRGLVKFVRFSQTFRWKADLFLRRGNNKRNDKKLPARVQQREIFQQSLNAVRLILLLSGRAFHNAVRFGTSIRKLQL